MCTLFSLSAAHKANGGAAHSWKSFTFIVDGGETAPESQQKTTKTSITFFGKTDLPSL